MLNGTVGFVLQNSFILYIITLIHGHIISTTYSSVPNYLPIKKETKQRFEKKVPR